MKVTVRSVGPLREVLGGAELELELPPATSIGGLLAHLAAEKGPGFAPYAAGSKEPTAYAPLRVVVNGRDFLPRQYGETVLAEGDDILMFTPIAGG